MLVFSCLLAFYLHHLLMQDVVPLIFKTISNICPICDRQMERKTSRKRTIITLIGGVRAIKEEYFVCPRCKDGQTGSRIIHHSECLRDIVPQNSRYGYDVEIEAGYLKYVDNKQMSEIKVIFKEEYGISVGQAQIHELGIRFLKHMIVVHYLAAPLLCKLFESSGCVYHIDATCEAGRGMELTIIEGWTGIVLGAWKIPSENKETIKQHLESTVRIFGEPVAFVSDMGKGMMGAIGDVTKEMRLNSRQLICHMHFIKAIGKKLMEDEFRVLKTRFKKQETLLQLKRFIKDTAKIIEPQAETVRDFLGQWQESDAQLEIPDYLESIAVLRALAQWVMEFGKECKGMGFPFALTHLKLFERCANALSSLLALLEVNAFNERAVKYAERLQRILQSPVENSEIQKTVKYLTTMDNAFTELRKILRLEKTDVYKDEKDKKVPDKIEVIAKLKEETSDFRKTLEQKLDADVGTKDDKYAFRVILDYLDKYECFLFDHFFILHDETDDVILHDASNVASLDDSDNVTIKLINRTNNVVENFYGVYKHQIRRRTGSKNLGFVFEHLFPAASMVLNLQNPIYQQIVLDNKTRGDLVDRFSALDDIMLYQETPMFQKDLDLIGGRLPRADKTFVGNPRFTEVISRLADQYVSSLNPQPT